MNYCHYKYADGICGVSEDEHSHSNKTKRLPHAFTPEPVSELDIELNPEGKLIFARDFQKGETVTIPVEFLGVFLEQIVPEGDDDGVIH